MNAENDGYRELSEAYRALAGEKAPTHLDRAVLAEAASAAGAARPVRQLPAWLRPVAFVATAVLSLTIVLEVTRTNDQPPPAMPAANETGGMAPRQNVDRVVPDGARKEEAQDSVPASDLSAAADAGGRLQRADREARQLIPEDSSAELPSAAPAAPDAAADRASAAADSGRFCSPRQSSSVESWWACIEQLRRAGNAEAADAEQALMQTAFPDFAPPD